MLADKISNNNNPVIQSIYERRSVKHFDPSHIMPDAVKKEILDAAKQTPSSFNIQHWRLLDIQDKKLREEIRLASWNQAQVTDASLLLVVCADLGAHSKDTERYWQTAPDDVKSFLVNAIHGFYKDNNQLQRDEAMRSVGLISQTIMLAAKSLGYDTCPMIGLEFNKVSKLINLPSDYEIGMMITIGKALQPARPKGGYISDQEFCKIDRF